MNLLAAIMEARKLGVSVTTRTGFTIGDTSIAPGLVDPEYLLANIGSIGRFYLLHTEMWEIEEKKISISLSDLKEAYSYLGYNIGDSKAIEMFWKILVEEKEL